MVTLDIGNYGQCYNFGHIRNRNFINPTKLSEALSQLPSDNNPKSWAEYRFPDVSEITALSVVTDVNGTATCMVYSRVSVVVKTLDREF